CSTILHTRLATSLFLGLNQLDYTLNVFNAPLFTLGTLVREKFSISYYIVKVNENLFYGYDLFALIYAYLMPLEKFHAVPFSMGFVVKMYIEQESNLIKLIGRMNMRIYLHIC
ncbi:hypothetical protein ACJX0J_028964, partial [Zea mays]